MWSGVALNCAVGADEVAAGAVSAGGTGGVFFLQPAIATRATATKKGAKTRKRRINARLLPQFSGDLTILCLHLAATRRLSGWCRLFRAAVGLCPLKLRFGLDRLPNICFTQIQGYPPDIHVPKHGCWKSGFVQHDSARDPQENQDEIRMGPHYAMARSFPTPIRHEVVTRVSQLVLICAIGKH